MFWDLLRDFTFSFQLKKRGCTRISRLLMMIYNVCLIFLVFKNGIDFFSSWKFLWKLVKALSASSSGSSFLSSYSMEASQHSSGLGYLVGPYCSRNFILILEIGFYFSDTKDWLVLCFGWVWGLSFFSCSNGSSMENICQLLPACGGVQHPPITLI